MADIVTLPRCIEILKTCSLIVSLDQMEFFGVHSPHLFHHDETVNVSQSKVSLLLLLHMESLELILVVLVIGCQGGVAYLAELELFKLVFDFTDLLLHFLFFANLFLCLPYLFLSNPVLLNLSR